ncbi:MAG: hypothetical protein SAL07_12210 [Oscillatoria sp. PMC 1051.18]|nr:hypothetical protein [Oscillatoria sp. PMC 1050.18]MEC5030651.1 hypothetical protein [Oscillatoria sp. PMC 1051.18]
MLERIVRGDGFSVATFDLAVFQVMTTLPQSWDIHDKIIAATACFYEATLITRDEVLLNSEIVTTLWD